MLYLGDDEAEVMGADAAWDEFAENPFNWGTGLAWAWLEGRAKATGFVIAMNSGVWG